MIVASVGPQRSGWCASKMLYAVSHTVLLHRMVCSVELHRMLLDTKELNTYYTLQNQTTTLQKRENLFGMACYVRVVRHNERTPISDPSPCHRARR